MSGWIKWEKDLESDPRVIRMARELKRLCNAPAFNPVTLVCGGLVRLWGFADTHIREDDTLDLGAGELDELIGITGFCSLMPSDWLREVDERTVELPGFQAHNGVEARKKALTQKRVETHRKRKSVTKDVTPALTTALPDQDLDQTRPKRERAARTKLPASKRVPQDFAPDLAYASSQIPDIDAEAEAQKFRDWEFKTPRSDWEAVWRTWIRNCKDNGKYSRKKPGGETLMFGGEPVKWQ